MRNFAQKICSFIAVSQLSLTLLPLPLLAEPSEESALMRTLTGPDAASLKKILADTGVTDTSGLLGADTLKVEQILCLTYILPMGVPECTVTFETAELRIPDQAAKDLLALLYKHEAFTPGPLGKNKLWIHDVTCRTFVVPDAVPNCEFLVGPKPALLP